MARQFIALILTGLMAFPVLSMEWHSPSAAKNLVGKVAMICGTVGSIRYAEETRGAPTYINLGPAFPDHVFTGVVWGSDREKFGKAPEELSGMICVHGPVTEYRGVPQIVITSPDQISQGE